MPPRLGESLNAFSQDAAEHTSSNARCPPAYSSRPSSLRSDGKRPPTSPLCPSPQNTVRIIAHSTGLVQVVCTSPADVQVGLRPRDCHEGEYMDGTGECTDCKAGTFKEGTGDGECSTCPPHTSSEAGSKRLKDCKCVAGYTAKEDGDACTACEVGTFKEGTGDGECSSCPPHRSSEAGSKHPEDCKCAAGYTATEDGDACTACEAGTWKSNLGANQCSPCPAGTSSASGSDSLDKCTCLAGYTASGNGVACTACAAGTFKAGTGASTCAPCAPGTSSAAGAVACTPSVTLTVVLETSLAEFGATMQDAYRAGVAASVGRTLHPEP